MASHDLDGLKIDVIDAPQEVIRDVSDTPIIFKCISCGTIVGDSTLWITANGKLRSITLLRKFPRFQTSLKYEVSRSPKVVLPISGNLGVLMSRVRSRVK